MQVSSRNSIADAVAGAVPDHGGFESVPASPSAASAHSHASSPPSSVHEHNTFRHTAAEIGFCFTIAMTQFLTEYLISGFAIELSKGPSSGATQSTSTGKFWPASLLSLILSAMLLIFARLSDMYGGYMCFMFGVVWLAIWTLIAGFWINSMLILDISRAMQGLAIAAFMPSTFAMVGSIYPEGPRKNFVLGLYSGCAPLGFFGGLLIAAALPVDQSGWYFWIAAGLSGITFVTAFLTVPSERTARRTPDRKMDWIGAVLITTGLILVSYGLAVEPYVRHSQQPGFPSWVVIGSLTLGLVLLAVALWYEGWCAKCPLLPFDFFAPKSVKAFCMACLCFYATYGAWLYNSVRFFQDPTGVAGGGSSSTSGTELAIWFLPTAIGGVVLCVVGGLLLHIVPIMVLLLLSALAWIAAPLLLVLAPLPLEYWKFVMPSMICATLGIDLTFTISIVFISSVQPLEYQGLAGAVCSILVNLAMSFALSISEIVSKKAASVMQGSSGVSPTTWGYRGAFTYAAASAAVGFIICALLVRISRSAVDSKAEGGRRGSTSSMSTMAEMRLGSWGVQNEAARSRLQGEAARSRLQGEAARSNV
ncbi:major facilitator superfamily domain-containing protein [Neohortaea acidophila]|uniref:Major facilitator superfamily domain-containing protein n=1 Tax=Neohortaea acidophila TaxID=245834 RepID=A0A6A6Q700_9PEZI|nr:major facilitator superfamily domain-containing protein [Neohortaea acidophila]KAF2488160.1 major facilitator superfamily domain-containing protein [Neohortaea acidophila]